MDVFSFLLLASPAPKLLFADDTLIKNGLTDNFDSVCFVVFVCLVALGGSVFLWGIVLQISGEKGQISGEGWVNT